MWALKKGSDYNKDEEICSEFDLIMIMLIILYFSLV